MVMVNPLQLVIASFRVFSGLFKVRAPCQPGVIQAVSPDEGRKCIHVVGHCTDGAHRVSLRQTLPGAKPVNDISCINSVLAIRDLPSFGSFGFDERKENCSASPFDNRWVCHRCELLEFFPRIHPSTPDYS